MAKPEIVIVISSNNGLAVDVFSSEDANITVVNKDIGEETPDDIVNMKQLY